MRCVGWGGGGGNVILGARNLLPDAAKQMFDCAGG